MKLFAILPILGLLYGCNITYTDHQDIPVEIFDEKSQNLKLIKELMYYDPNYYIAKVQFLNKENAHNIRYGSFETEDTDKVYFRITYNLMNRKMRKNKENYMKQFEEFFKRHLLNHVKINKNISIIKKEADVWASQLFSKKYDNVWARSGEFFKKTMTKESFFSNIDTFFQKAGNFVKLEYKSPQFYESYDNNPELVSLNYIVECTKLKSIKFRISLNNANGKWKVIGLGIR